MRPHLEIVATLRVRRLEEHGAVVFGEDGVLDVNVGVEHSHRASTVALETGARDTQVFGA